MVSICALVLCIGAFALTGCSDSNDAGSPNQEASVVTVIDSAGREVSVPQPVERIISLAPANTETLFALGLGDKVVGVTTFDNYPAQVEGIEKVSDFMTPNIEMITSLTPDLILATGGVQGETIAALEKTGAPVLVIDPMTIDDILGSFAMIGSATGAEDAARALVAQVDGELAAIKAEAEASATGDDRISAFLEIGQNPLFTVGEGTLLDEMLSIAGGINVVKEPGYVPYSAEQVIADNPAVYFVTAGSGITLDEVKARDGYRDISAIKDGRVFMLDEDIVSRPGPRFVEGIKLIQDGILKALAR
jgi:iron complex transport system substrate-binding protein